MAQANIDALAPQREVVRVNLLAEIARPHLAITTTIRERQIAEADIEQRRRTVSGASRRLEAGASPESVVLTAQAALAEAELVTARSNPNRWPGETSPRCGTGASRTLVR